MLDRSWRFIPPVVVLLAAVVPYLGVFDAPFVFDDVRLVQQNTLLSSGLEDSGGWLGTFDVTSRRWDAAELRPNYRPLRFLSYLIDYELSLAWLGPFPADDPPVFFFHLTNVLLHALNSLLVFWISRALARSCAQSGPGCQAAFFGLTAGLIFALHPLATEAVTYISGRRDVLSTFFFLAAMALYLRAAPQARPGPLCVLLVPLFFVAGLLCKEMVVTLPPALALVDLVRRARWNGPRILLHVLLWATALAFVAITLSNSRLIAAAPGGMAQVVILTACRYLARYLFLVLLPIHQSVDYSFAAIPQSTGILDPWATLPSVLLVVALVGLALWQLQVRVRGKSASSGRALLALGFLWFIGTLVPVLQVVPIAERFAERFAYLPTVGIILIVAVVLTRLRRFDRVLGWSATGFVCLILLAATVHRNRDWSSRLALWTSAVQAQPRAARAHMGRANALKEAWMLRDAASEYSQALSIFEEQPSVPLHHGYILQGLTLRGGVYGLLAGTNSPQATDPTDGPGETWLELAVKDYRRVLAMTDTDGTRIEASEKHTALHTDLAGFLLNLGRRADAVMEYRRVIEIGAPVSHVSGAHYYLGKIARLEGDFPEATASLERAYASIPATDPSKFPVAIELVDLLTEMRELDRASRMVDRALSDGAVGKMKLHLLTREAKILDRRGEMTDCMAVLQQILDADPTYWPALLALGDIESNLGKYDKAAERFRAVLSADPGNVEAARGLQSLKIRQGTSTGTEGGGETSDEEQRQLLAAVEKKAREDMKKGKILAARDLFANVLARATSIQNREAQMQGLRGIAAAEEKLGRYQKAVASLESALALEPSDAVTLRCLADVYLRSVGDKEEAQALYERYLAVLQSEAEADPLVLVNLGQLLCKADPARALRYFEWARDQGHDTPTLDRDLGYVHAEVGRLKTSLEAFNRYFERTPVVDEAGREDPQRAAARLFVRERVLPFVEE